MSDLKWFVILILGVTAVSAASNISDNWKAVETAKIQAAERLEK